MSTTPSYRAIFPAPTRQSDPAPDAGDTQSANGEAPPLHGAARRGDDDPPQPRRDEASSDSLDYFEPAFRRLLGEHPAAL